MKDISIKRVVVKDDTLCHGGAGSGRKRIYPDSYYGPDGLLTNEARAELYRTKEAQGRSLTPLSAVLNYGDYKNASAALEEDDRLRKTVGRNNAKLAREESMNQKTYYENAKTRENEIKKRNIRDASMTLHERPTFKQNAANAAEIKRRSEQIQKEQEAKGSTVRGLKKAEESALKKAEKANAVYAAKASNEERRNQQNYKNSGWTSDYHNRQGTTVGGVGYDPNKPFVQQKDLDKKWEAQKTQHNTEMRDMLGQNGLVGRIRYRLRSVRDKVKKAVNKLRYRYQTR